MTARVRGRKICQVWQAVFPDGIGELWQQTAYAVVDAQGRTAAEDTLNGFDEKTIQQIREYLHPKEPEKSQDMSRMPDGKPRQEIWQKYFENGEYLRSVESGTEDNYNMVDGIRNNRRRQTEVMKEAGNLPETSTPGERVSVLKRLREKQAEVAARYGRQAPEQVKDDMERNRK